MSLYNMLFGMNHLTPILLHMLNLPPGNIPRFRDCYLRGGYIVVHTRTGGGNREFYDVPNKENTDGPWNSTLRESPYYVRDEDDSFDTTYADFYFKFPDEFAEHLKELEAHRPDQPPSEKWQELFASLQKKKETPS